jgi:sugar fermentation stimulation protein A
VFIPHAQTLLEGRFLARYDRFIARVSLGASEVDAHCVNTGRMEGLIRPGARAWLSEAPAESKRKLRYTLELLEIDGVLIGVNTLLPNRLAEAVVRARLVPGLKRFSKLEREVRYGENSRVDLLLSGRDHKHWVEVKNCHLVYPDSGAYFPDSVSARAAGHLEELSLRVQAGDKATVLFVVQRDDAGFVRPSALHDPVFAAAAGRAWRAGVRFKAIAFRPGPEGFRYLGSLPVNMRRYNSAKLEGYRLANADSSGWRRRGKR